MRASAERRGKKAASNKASPHGATEYQNGQGHDFEPGSGAGIMTSSLAFFAAWVNDDAVAKSTLTQAVSVEGGLDDNEYYKRVA